VCVVCTAQMEIRTGIDLKRTKLAMDLNLREEVTKVRQLQMRPVM